MIDSSVMTKKDVRNAIVATRGFPDPWCCHSCGGAVVGLFPNGVLCNTCRTFFDWPSIRLKRAARQSSPDHPGKG